MRRFEPALDQHRPSCVLVVGDVNSTLACTLVAVKKDVPVAHVEAGLRSFDPRSPWPIPKPYKRTSDFATKSNASRGRMRLELSLPSVTSRSAFLS